MYAALGLDSAWIKTKKLADVYRSIRRHFWFKLSRTHETRNVCFSVFHRMAKAMRAAMKAMRAKKAVAKAAKATRRAMRAKKAVAKAAKATRRAMRAK